LGLTLIELLIVIAILGALASVIVPNVARFFHPEEAVEELAIEVVDGLLVVHYSRMEAGEPYHFEYLGTSMVAVKHGSGFVDVYTLDAYHDWYSKLSGND